MTDFCEASWLMSVMVNNDWLMCVMVNNDLSFSSLKLIKLIDVFIWNLWWTNYLRMRMRQVYCRDRLYGNSSKFEINNYNIYIYNNWYYDKWITRRMSWITCSSAWISHTETPLTKRIWPIIFFFQSLFHSITISQHLIPIKIIHP